MKKITIVGAGFSGLTLAHELTKKGFQVEIHEKSSRAGGLLGTLRTEHGLVETAANGMMRGESVDRLFAELNLMMVAPLEVAKKRYIFRGRPRRWPLNIGESLLFGLRMVFHGLTRKKFLPAKPGETVHVWSEKRLGKAATNYLVGPALQGIYAGNTKKLSAGLIFNPLFKKNRRRYRGTISCANGMQDLISALQEKLISQKVQFHFESDFQISDLENPVVVATSAGAAVHVLKPLLPELAKKISSISLASLVTVTTFWQSKEDRYPGFGCLVPASEGKRTLGILMNSFIFPGRGKTYSETYILGGANDPAIVQETDEKILAQINLDRKQIFAQENKMVASHITRWPQALPEYNVNLEEILQDLQTPPNVFLHGNYLGSIGLSKILDRSIELAEEIAKIYG